MNIVEAIESHELFRPAFKDLRTWAGWVTLLKVFFDLELTKKDLALYRESTGRQRAPEGEFKELWAIIGRRGGKSFIASVIAVYLALFHDYSKHLSPGERGVIQVIAADRAQAQVILRYIKGILRSNQVFAQYIQNQLKESIDLTNSIRVEVMPCSYRSIRGRTVVCGIFDEIAFWRIEGANPDREILTALRPSMASIPNSKLIVISSPYARHGVLYEHHRQYFGVEDPEILVWQSPTRAMNPNIAQSLIDREAVKDPSAARAEWLAEFREDIESFLSPEAVDGCVIPDRKYLPPETKARYVAFVDPSGGRHDAFTLAIGHSEGQKIVIDLLRAWDPPFDPQGVVRQIADLLAQYRLMSVTGDRYSGEWVVSAFESAGVRYHASQLAKSDLYLNLEPKVNMGLVELPDDERLVKELLALERRRGRGGKDSVDHPPRGRDDRANVVAGAIYQGFLFTGLVFPELMQRGEVVKEI